MYQNTQRVAQDFQQTFKINSIDRVSGTWADFDVFFGNTIPNVLSFGLKRFYLSHRLYNVSVTYGNVLRLYVTDTAATVHGPIYVRIRQGYYEIQELINHVNSVLNSEFQILGYFGSPIAFAMTSNDNLKIVIDNTSSFGGVEAILFDRLDGGDITSFGLNGAWWSYLYQMLGLVSFNTKQNTGITEYLALGGVTSSVQTPFPYTTRLPYDSLFVCLPSLPYSNKVLTSENVTATFIIDITDYDGEMYVTYMERLYENVVYFLHEQNLQPGMMKVKLYDSHGFRLFPDGNNSNWSFEISVTSDAANKKITRLH